MEKKTIIRKCSEKDFSGVLGLLKQLRPKRTFVVKDAKKNFIGAIKSVNQFYFCAEQDKKLVGFGSLNIKHGLYAMDKVVVLDELIVDNSHRQQGIAQKLVDFMVSFAKKNKCVCIELECGSKRKPAHAFYEKYGFDKGIGCFFSMDLV